ncbi:MAG: Do family serine endopeptidase [Candidatus Eisenbacteria bacterium]|uniref:Do family serine endopeptidase n=1 Tax=Eiseniibacteriota bacterium TaxID=2212470 RepID=A0A538TSK0_UNCEI|nr:MAG: Do family serine endopeptidase [Candidatus Eisenbacteria bacterium]TMQ66565.1 MAG: Do family serine endopeptidase [Candidatus Eisenbacteria bacterium]
MESKETIRAAKVLILAGGILAIGIVVGFILAGNLSLSPITQAKETSVPAVTSLDSPFTQIADRVLPAVVTIDTKRTVDGDGSPQLNFEGPYGDFFKRLFPDQPNQPKTPRTMRIPSSGSGFIIEKDGRILTNNHVIRDASDITVILNDKRKFKAKVVGSDPSTDVAVIKINADGDLPTVPLGDSDDVRIGDWAVAIGNALGELSGTLTVGVISGKGRTNLSIVGGAPAYQDFIQTDASINFGNSGGPLLNIHGEAIGINTAINPSGEGIGFAIPINMAKHISGQLIAHGKVTRGWLGIAPQELTPELADSWGLRNVSGVLVASVSQDTPADSAGFHVKDVITEFDGRKVSDVQNFRLLVADTPVNKKVRVHVLREGQPRDIYVRLGERPDEKLLGRRNAPPTEILGLSVEPVTGDFAKQNDIREKTGVVVTEVTQGTPADDAGVTRGDVIKEVNDAKVRDVSDYNAAIDRAKAKNPRKPIILLIKRGDATQFLAVDPEG